MAGLSSAADIATDTADKMIASAPECRRRRIATVPPRTRVPASDIAAVDGNATLPLDLTSYVIADGDLANGELATSIFQMARSLQCMSLLTN